MAQKSLRRPTQWMAAMSNRWTSLSGHACAWTPHGFYLWGFPSRCRREVWVYHQTAFRGSTPDFPLRLSSEVFFTSGYFHKTVGVWNLSFPSPRWAAKGYRAKHARLPFIPLVPRSQHVVFDYDQVVGTHRSYSPSVGPATCGFACNCPEPEAWKTEVSGHTSFEVVQASITSQPNTQQFFCLYRPLINRRNNLTDSMFTEQLPDILYYVNNLPGFACLVGDMNIHFDNPLQPLIKQTLTTLGLHILVQVIDEPT